MKINKKNLKLWSLVKTTLVINALGKRYVVMKLIINISILAQLYQIGLK
jgi:hypothetical protein